VIQIVAGSGSKHRRGLRPEQRCLLPDTIIFATNDPASGLMRVAAAGGEPEVLTTPNRDQGELDHLFPEVLPGGQAVLFTVTTAGGLSNAQIAVFDLTCAWRITKCSRN
jgi:hypothetical protein